MKEAISSALQQIDFTNYEVMIIDNDEYENNSGIENVIRDFNDNKIILYKNEKNIGMFGNWNRCIELARGKWITILNDDDWLEKDFLKEVVKYRVKNKAIYTKTKVNDMRINSNIVKKENRYKNIIRKYIRRKKIRILRLFDFLFSNNSDGSLGILFKRSKLIQLGGYNEEYFPISDYVLHSKYILKYGGLQVDKILTNYRILENACINPEINKLFPEKCFCFRKYLKKHFKYLKYLGIFNYLINDLYYKDLKSVKRLWCNNFNDKSEIENSSKIINYFIIISKIVSDIY